MIELRIRRGEITKNEWQTHLNGLPDVSDKATVCNPFDELRSDGEDETSLHETLNTHHHLLSSNGELVSRTTEGKPFVNHSSTNFRS